MQPARSSGRSAPARSRASIASDTAARFNSSSRPCIPCAARANSLQLNVLALMTSAPASIKSAWMARTVSGISAFASAAHAPSEPPRRCTSVPTPPSSRAKPPAATRRITESYAMLRRTTF